jgi:murein DD-endopeptidase MepM/ murein hydrolase activator NlpD
VAATFKADLQDILLYPGNEIDLANPVFEPGRFLVIPGGSREFRTWVVPTIPRGPAGVNRSIFGPGACDTSAGGAFGSGTFVWPTVQRVLSGNDYWPGHLAIDIAAFTGDPVFASDSGVVVYAGPVGGGYGNMVLIDHGNGYQTLYAHLSSWSVRCGASVFQGRVIGQAGSTGRSTGPHLHFEVRYLGGFVNPWYVLP